MARYVGPVCRLCRRNADKLFQKGTTCFAAKCVLEKRSKAPGQSLKHRRPKISERGAQLREKQKARVTYHVMERQFRRFFGEAARQTGITGENLIVLLERRLDNVVFRLGFADSRRQARQLIRHGHIMLNNRKTNVPSSLVKEGDAISWRPGSTDTTYYKNLTQSIQSKTVVNWLNLDRQTLSGQVVSLPTPADVEEKFDAKAITEYYAR